MQNHGLGARVAEFLQRFPPYSFLPRQELEVLAGQVRIQYYADGDYLFRAGDAPRHMLFVLNKGAVELYQPGDTGEDSLIDLCDEGDTFGARAFLSGGPYVTAAKVKGEALVYAIPREALEPVMNAQPRFSMFFAAGFAAGMAVVRDKPDQLRRLRQELGQRSAQRFFQESDPLILHALSQVLTCAPEESVATAAARMAGRRAGSIVVADANGHPIGILTHTDISRKVVAKGQDPGQPVAGFMSAPVVTVPNGIPIAQAMMEMMTHNIRHLVVTADGSPQSAATGVISDYDVLTMESNNPAVLLKRIRKAEAREELRALRDRAEHIVFSYLRQEMSIPFVAGIITRINDALIQKAAALAVEKLRAEGLGAPPLPFCWLSLGSEGRSEQLLRTDQDNGLVYADPPPAAADAAKAYFLRLGAEITQILEYCGFALCPANMMANNPDWNLPLSDWKAQFSRWIETPEEKALLYASIFFDFRPCYGDESLALELSLHIRKAIAASGSFIHFFAKNALENPPPLSFFKNFIVERSGEHKNKFDIKKRGMMPLADAARVLAYSHGIGSTTGTLARYRALAELEPENADVLQEAAEAYELFMRLRALDGFEHQDSGRFIDPDQLPKMDREAMKLGFRTIEEVQKILHVRFTLSLFR